MQSSIAIGALFGCIVAGPAVDLLGRKVSIIAGAIPLELGWLLLYFAKNRLMLYFGRIIAGLGCGVETLAVAVSFTVNSLKTNTSVRRTPSTSYMNY